MGQGRTGTVLAAYLIREGKSPTEALAMVRAACPGAVECRLQEQSLVEFAGRREWLMEQVTAVLAAVVPVSPCFREVFERGHRHECAAVLLLLHQNLSRSAQRERADAEQFLGDRREANGRGNLDRFTA